MNFEFAQRINYDLERFDFDKAVLTAETALRQLPPTPFHDAIGKPMAGLAGALADWMEDFFKKASVNMTIGALYVEINEFDINTDLWYVDAFAFGEDGGQEDMEWLCDFGADSQSATDTVFGIGGYETVQRAFEEASPGTASLQDARDWCEQLIIARFMELTRAAHLLAKQRGMEWAGVPVYFTEHAYDFILRSAVD